MVDGSGRSIQVLGRQLDLWQGVTYVLMAVYGSVILATFGAYGVTVDEYHHVRYGREIAQWYGSFFQDQEIFASKNTWLYGGTFDLACHVVSLVLPLDRYDANHLCNALVSLLGVWAAYRIGVLVGGTRAGFVCAVALLLTPRYYGHGFNNPKDIPFAVGYLWSVYFLLRGLAGLPGLSWRLIFQTGLVVGLTLGVRIGGVVVLGYVGLFYGIRYVQVWRLGGGEVVVLARSYVVEVFGVVCVSYGVMLVFWPWGQVHPVDGVWQAVATFASFVEPHTSFFNGQYVLNTDIPRTYALRWLFLTLPEFVFVGLLAWVVRVWWDRGSGVSLGHGLLLFSGLFPVSYAVVTRMPLYDGIRHLLFAIPPLVVFAALGLDDVLDRFAGVRRYVGVGAGVLFGWVGLEMVMLHPNQVVYFNRLVAGGVARASERYETDYWCNSFKQGLRWIESQGDLRGVGEKVRLGSFYENLPLMVDVDRFDVDVDPETADLYADLYMGTTRFDFHRMVPGEVVHVVRAGGAPLLYIIRPDTSYQSDPFFAESPAMHYRRATLHYLANRRTAALASYLKVKSFQEKGIITAGITREHLYVRVGNVYEELGRYQEALDYYQQAIAIVPRNEKVYNNIGVVYTQLKDYRTAAKWLQRALEISPTYLEAYMNLAGVYKLGGDNERALATYKKALMVRPESVAVNDQVGQ
ncbi:MAG: tetratricopeptide repeat protein, partial [bacterium]|nr:tetratricopeptide repeat protein [bacterium]